MVGVVTLATLTAATNMAAGPDPAGSPGQAEALAKAYHERGELDGVVLVAEAERVRFLGAW